MKITNANMVDLDGKVVTSMGTDVVMTVAGVLVNCALAPLPQGSAPRSKADVSARYDLAIKLHTLALGQEIEIDDAMVKLLETDLLRIYTPLICGQMLMVLGGKTIN